LTDSALPSFEFDYRYGVDVAGALRKASRYKNSASDLMSAEWEGGDIANEERILIKGGNKPV
jgi:hypothetical protein